MVPTANARFSTNTFKERRGSEQDLSMNSSMACRYSCFDSAVRWLLKTAALLRSSSGRPRFGF